MAAVCFRGVPAGRPSRRGDHYMHRRVMTVVSQVAELGVFVAAAAALGAGLMALH